MRLRRLSFIAGWAAVALLAIAGFAAFGTSGSTQADLDFDASEARLGHGTGARAGLVFAVLAGDGSGPIDPGGQGEVAVAPASEEAEEEPVTDAASSETIASDTAGWLSQVQVRALVSEYFAEEDVNKAVRVAWCESRFSPSSTNLRTGAVGLFQHLPKYWEERAEKAGFPNADPTDPVASTAAAAWAVYNGGGWDTFACRG
ncbi:MAG TPA: transglycosylase SLT domain-containing protein [Acidimicrobiia bacterium]|nr:transglycosylase SLT domain-containing protein [Acidimicrobiia bacterium]